MKLLEHKHNKNLFIIFFLILIVSVSFLIISLYMLVREVEEAFWRICIVNRSKYYINVCGPCGVNIILAPNKSAVIDRTTRQWIDIFYLRGYPKDSLNPDIIATDSVGPYPKHYFVNVTVKDIHDLEVDYRKMTLRERLRESPLFISVLTSTIIILLFAIIIFMSQRRTKLVALLAIVEVSLILLLCFI